MRQNKIDKGYHKLLIWQKSKDLVLLIYKYTKDFPSSEEFGLKSQLRRAVVSIVLNIVEGYRRNSKKEFLRFLDISVGSLAEVEAGSELSFFLEFISENHYEEIEAKRSELAFLLDNFIKGVKNKRV